MRLRFTRHCPHGVRRSTNDYASGPETVMGNFIGSILKNGMLSEALEAALTGALNAGDERVVYAALLLGSKSK